MYKVSEFTKSVYRLGEAAKYIGVTTQTLHNYDRDGIIKCDRTSGGHRMVTRESLLEYLDKQGLLFDDTNISGKRDVIYARVSNNEQKVKGDLDRQVVKVLEGFEGNINNPVILKEVGSGLNDKRHQLLRLLNMIMKDEVSDVYVTYKDRLTRFGYHYIETICFAKGVTIHVLDDKAGEKDVQKELVDDMMMLIASFSGKLYGMRSHKKG